MKALWRIFGPAVVVCYTLVGLSGVMHGGGWLAWAVLACGPLLAVIGWGVLWRGWDES